MHVQGVRVRESLETDMILVRSVAVFLVDLRAVLLHGMLSHLDLRDVLGTTSGVAADRRSDLVGVGQGCMWSRVTIEEDMMSLLKGVDESKPATKRTSMQAYVEHLGAVNESVFGKLAVCRLSVEGFVA